MKMNFKNSKFYFLLSRFFVVVLIFVWIFSGWPRIWQKPAIPPEIQEVQAVTTGGKYPTLGESVKEAPWGDNAWTTPKNIYADDAATANVTAATFDAGDQTYVLKATGFDFSAIPDGSTINGVTVRINSWYRTGQGSGSMDLCQLLDTTKAKVGTNQCATAVPLTTNDTTIITKGSAIDLWGNALTTAWVKSANFGVAIGIIATAANADVDVDYVTIEIDYTPPTFEQSAYRLFNNTDSTDVGTALAAQDTAATLGSTGAAFRLRTLLHIGAAQLGASAQSFKLQFAQQSGTCDTAFSGETYADVTAATVIAYNDNATPLDGATLTANASDPTHSTDTIVNQTYEELNNFTNSVAAIPSGQDGKWDFSLKDNGATADTAYCLRAVKSDGALLDTYTVILQITTASAAVVSVSVSDGAITYGTIPANTTKSTCSAELNDAQTATNDGNVTENFLIRGQNSVNWTLGSTAGSNVYVHKFVASTCSTFPAGTALTTSDQTFATGIPVSGTATLNLQINTPNPSTVYTQQSVDVIITAVAQ